MGYIDAVAQWTLLLAARFAVTRVARNVEEWLRVARIGNVEDGGAVVLDRSRQRVHRLAAVMPDVGDEAIALPVHQGLVGAPRLQRVGTHQLHVAFLRAAGRLRETRKGDGEDQRHCSGVRRSHIDLLRLSLGAIELQIAAPRLLRDDRPALRETELRRAIIARDSVPWSTRG